MKNHQITEGLIKKETGLPYMSEEEKNKRQNGGIMALFIAPIFVQGIGLGIGCAIHFLGSKDLYEKRITQLREYDLQWAYLSAFVFSMLVFFQNFYPMQYKSRVMR